MLASEICDGLEQSIVETPCLASKNDGMDLESTYGEIIRSRMR